MNILTTGSLGKEFYNSMVNNNLGLNVVYVEKLSQNDIEWADSLASFAPSDNVNLSGINWIHSFGAGVEAFLKRRDLSDNLVISRTVGELGLKMGEYCLCHILNYTQNTYDIFHNNIQKKWIPTYPSRIKNKTALILGTGEMAKGISQIIREAGVKSIGINTKGDQIEEFDNCVAFKDLKLVSNEVDFVINTLPLTNSTDKLLDHSFFNCFNGILFINTGRGRTVNTDDLQIAIKNRNCNFAVLDVFEEEPLPPDSPLWSNKNILVTPHQAAVTDVNDILLSFMSALESIKQQEDNNLFVDINKGY